MCCSKNLIPRFDAMTSPLPYKPDYLGGSATSVQVSHFRSEEGGQHFWIQWIASNLGRVCILRGDRESSPSCGNGVGLTKHRTVERLKGSWEDKAV